jgi:NarL family two-component system response regulator LiaR
MRLVGVKETRPARRIESAVNGEALSVVLVDDDARFRAGLAAVLADQGVRVAGEASTGEEALSVVAELAPDVVLMDLAMPGIGGVEATRRLAEAAPASAVLILATSADDQKVVQAMIAGASGYVLKGTSPQSLAADIRVAAHGECVMSASIAARLFGSSLSARTTPALSSLLSKREVEILAMIANGKQNSDIADALVISPYTVRNHISNLLRKLQLENRTQAAMYAARHGVG